MRKLTLRDILATLVVAAVVVPFIGYPVLGSMPFAHDPRGMAGVGIAGCLLTFAERGRDALGRGAFERVMVTLGVLTVGSGSPGSTGCRARRWRGFGGHRDARYWGGRRASRRP